ncbi:L-asparaginase [Dietzia psychralcaliphila]|uniref:L-asparaginase n=1 Tax=Dietzia psychralcaliphila TaxID=139021 RepID=A0AAD0JPG8_9ACTN|nr:L-asparaginase [Dietzia psychralcaliphila]PTM87417.1 L-asparaginase [Dietzia psychralcaliphila]
MDRVNSVETSTDTPHVVICTTGGTITASTAPGGVVVAGDSDVATQAMLDELRTVLPASVRVSARAVLDADSSTFGPPEWDRLVDVVADVLADPGVSGVVVAHGTDTLEETVMALDLHHTDPRPVAVTGAQLPADHPKSDGPANLLDAVLLAADPVSRGLGVLVVLGRAILQARGVRKWHTTEPVAFARNAPDTPVEGLPPELERPTLPGRARFTGTRVDVVSCPPGSDAVALGACVDAGARGLVLEGSGSGNLPPLVAEAVTELSVERPDIVVVTASRVPRGEATATYSGPGGGAELAKRGVLSSGYLRSAQARVLLTALLSLADTNAGAGAEAGADASPEAGAAAVRRQWSRYHLYS